VGFEGGGADRKMSLYTQFVAGAFFPIHESLKGHDTVRVRRGMEKSQWLEPEQIEALQTENLRRFLSSVDHHSSHLSTITSPVTGNYLKNWVFQHRI